MNPINCDVLIVGAGPAGSALAADLIRRGVTTRIVDRGEHSFSGSRAKGVQPRTQEVLDDLGLIEEARSEGSAYPLVGLHLGPVVLPVRMQSRHKRTNDVPYPNALLLGQNRTDALLHRLIERSGGTIEYATGFESLEQSDDSVTTRLSTGEAVRSRFVVGADGGGSAVRKAVGITFVGETDAADRMIIVDTDVDGLSRNRWHMWPGRKGRGVAACPLPGGTQFQVMIRLDKDEEVDLSEESVAARFRAATRLTLHNITWSSVFRPNVRLADSYRAGRVFLVGDAAHVHTPAGGQGLNTGIQDANNLGWKIGQVLAGADDSLLDSYETERRPIAAGVLALSSALYAKLGASRPSALKRGDAERQLSVTYAGGPLAPMELAANPGLRSGDRAPDAVCSGVGVSRLFDALRGPHFTLLVYGTESEEQARSFTWSDRGAPLHIHRVTSANSRDPKTLADPTGDLTKRYHLKDAGMVLIRPDGYVAAIGSREVKAACGLLGPRTE